MQHDTQFTGPLMGFRGKPVPVPSGALPGLPEGLPGRPGWIQGPPLDAPSQLAGVSSGGHAAKRRVQWFDKTAALVQRYDMMCSDMAWHDMA